MIKRFAISVACYALALAALAHSDDWKFTAGQKLEMNGMVTSINLPSLAWRAAVIQRMIAEANFFVDRLHLPVPRPMQVTDIVSDYVPRPWFCIIEATNPPYLPASIFGTNIYNAAIPRELRLRALEFGVKGQFETTNFEFGFYDGKLCHVMRLDAPEVERYALRLDDLVGKPSLIDTNGAYRLATRWLADLGVDMTGLNELRWTVNQLHYLPRGASNAVTLPIYYVDFNYLHAPANKRLLSMGEPAISVEILGATKELQNLIINDLSLSRRPLLLITNALDLIRTPNPPLKQLQPARSIQTNSASP
ncbi:MAG: hypothetical protein KGJ60_11030 [Verrucomicrobiota bacterium]|nr:hypothetical protein [Verrucomicrobiota bacterium]